MTIQDATYFLLNKLRTIYPDGEADTITDWVMEHITGSKKAERMVYKKAEITSSEESELIQLTQRLMTHEPVQYVLGEAWFCAMKLFVNKNVLIPRPETEELVNWIITDYKAKPGGESLRILDIGTGSGCIPIAIKNKIPASDLWSCDSSILALEVAKKNSENLDCSVKLMHLDFLDKLHWWELGQFDIIVSNPPYVTDNEKKTIQPNVLEHEPLAALFVPGDDPLLFYKAIADFGKSGLDIRGTIYVEINEILGPETMNVFKEKGFRTEIRKDMQGKDRMLKCQKD